MATTKKNMKTPFIQKTPAQQRNLSLQVARKLIKTVKSNDKTGGAGLPHMVQQTVKQILRSGNPTISKNIDNDDNFESKTTVPNIPPQSTVYPARLQKLITIHQRTNKFGASREARIDQKNFLAGPQGVDKTGAPLELDK
jgi:hypothetical protein